MRFAFIEQHVGAFPVRLMCRVLEVSPSGFYAWRSRPKSARAASDRHLLAKVRRLEAQHHGRYGSPRMHVALRAEGHSCNRGRVERLMRRHTAYMEFGDYPSATTLTIRNVDRTLREQLRRRAARHGHSMEAELRQILRDTLATERSSEMNLAEAIHRRIEPLGGVDPRTASACPGWRPA